MLKGFQLNYYLLPVCPKPPAPLSVSASSLTSIKVACSCFDIIICAILSPSLMIKSSVDKLTNITQLDFYEVSNIINKDNINILIDLKGYTNDSKMQIFALRPAPIQVTYLGFTGSTGADFIDYNIVDKILVPKETEKYYSEKLIYMPGCYQINSSRTLSNK